MRRKHNLGFCGSCWSFGTAETIESHWAISTGQLMDLSEQQILDCTVNSGECGGSGGCNGGTPEIAYQQIMKTGNSHVATKTENIFRNYDRVGISL